MMTVNKKWSKRFVGLLPALVMAIFAVLTVALPKSFSASAGTATLKVDLNQAEGISGEGIHDVSETLYGIFFEDINHGADGGMSAEMVVNQSFEYQYITYNSATKAIVDDNLKWWRIDSAYSAYGSREVVSSGGMSATNSKYLRIASKVKGYKLFNAGFQGDEWHSVGTDAYISPNTDDYAMNIIEDNIYEFSVYVKQDKTAPYTGSLDIYVKNLEGDRITQTASFMFDTNSSTEWTKISAKIKGTSEDLGALVLDFQGKGTLSLDFVSLMPTNAYGYDDSRFSGGLIKKEIVEIFEKMNPTFLRFPGGCVAEGDVSWDNVYDWQRTVGALTDRDGTPNTWEYWQSFNIGFYEYFLLCDDLDMKAMPVVSAGLICQGRMGENGALIYKYDDPEFIEQVVNKALHLIYFAKGDPNSADPDEKKWAGLRADMGHPEPFELDYISLGNENWGRAYWDNFAAAVSELRNYSYGHYKNNATDMLEKWGITIVTTSGTYHSGTDYNNAWREVNGGSASNVTDAALYTDMIVDEHYYDSAAWYRNNTSRYDSYSRNGAKVFVGEYSANQPSANTINTLEAALAEAAFMTGLEKNSDIVVMASYAPFFGRLGNSQWQTNAIWLNAKNIMLTPNYHVQQMFGANLGDKYIPAQFSSALSGAYQSITQDTENNRIIVKLVNTSATDHSITIDLSDVNGINGSYTGTKMQHNNPGIKNALADDYAGEVISNVAPVELAKTSFSGGEATYNMEKYSVSVLIFTYGTESNDADLEDLRIIGGVTQNFSADKTEYKVTLPENSAIPYVIANASDKKASVKIEYARDMKEQTNVIVTAQNGSTKTYTITYHAESTSDFGKDDDQSGGCRSEISTSQLALFGLACVVLSLLFVVKIKKPKQKRK